MQNADIANTMFASSTSLLCTNTRPFLTPFQLVCHNASLLTTATDINRAESDEWNQAGVYLWSAILCNDPLTEHVVYVGKTRSLSRRVREYRRGFQVHSPNDYKLQIFQRVVRSKDELATFRLYFRSGLVGEITATETEAIRHFDPILNRRAPSTVEARSEFQSAFEKYYAAGFYCQFTAPDDAEPLV